MKKPAEKKPRVTMVGRVDLAEIPKSRTTNEIAAEIWGKCDSRERVALHRLRQRGEGPRCVLIGGVYRYPKDAAAEYLKSLRQAVA